MIWFGALSTVSAAAPSGESDRHVPAAQFVAPAGTKLAWRPGHAPQLLWTGFRNRPPARGIAAGSEVLLQISGDVKLETRPSTAPGRSVFVLRKCHALRRTDRLPLETRFFDSPVTRVAIKQRGGDLEIEIALRQPATATSRKEVGPGGSSFWVLDFARDSQSTAPTTTAAATP
jgi:hypothetical protein